MSKDRLKHTVIAPRTREEMEALVGEITALKIQERQFKAELDAELAQVRERYEVSLARINDCLAPKLPRARAWAEAHPSDFGARKSIEMLHGTIGWRINTPSLKTLSGWTWKSVLENLKRAGGWSSFIRVKEEVNKEYIIASREHLLPGDLKEIGVRIVQEEEFFVEPKLTDSDKRETAA